MDLLGPRSEVPTSPGFRERAQYSRGAARRQRLPQFGLLSITLFANGCLPYSPAVFGRPRHPMDLSH